MAGTLTVSGNEITDATRAAGVQGDGLTAPAGFGIWEATTNLENSAGADVSFETGTTGYTTGGTNTIASSATQAKFGSKSCKATYSNDATLLDIALTLTAAAQSAARWLWIPTAYDGGGVSVQFANYVGATGTAAVAANMAVRDQWQQVQAPNYTPAAGDLAGNVQVVNTGAAPTAGRFIYIDGAQTETKAICTPFTTNPRPAGRVQAPASPLLDRTQCWFAIRLRMGFPSTLGSDSYFPMLWNDGVDAQNDQLSIYIGGGGSFQFRSFDASGQDNVLLSPAYAVGDHKTRIFACTAAQLKGSVDGAAFTTTTRNHIPRAGIQGSTFDIGGRNTEQVESNVLWFACGTGTLTDADAATLNALGDTPPTLTTLPAAAQMTAILPMLSPAYTVPADWQPDATSSLAAVI